MRKADKKKTEKDAQAPVSPARVTELADKDLEQVQGGFINREPLLIKPRK